jgi:hypothetical protein
MAGTARGRQLLLEHVEQDGAAQQRGEQRDHDGVAGRDDGGDQPAGQ